MLPHFFQTPWRLSNIINAFPQGSRGFGLSTWCSCSPCWCALFLVSCGRRRSQFFLLRIVDDKMLQVETGWMFPWFWKMPNCSNSRGFIGRWTDISSVTNAQGITGLHPALRKDATCSWLFSLFNIAAHSVYIEYKHHRKGMEGCIYRKLCFFVVVSTSSRSGWENTLFSISGFSGRRPTAQAA